MIRNGDEISVLQRFALRVELDHDSGCWNWTGAIQSKGYPAIRVSGAMQLAHRLSHELFIGPVPPNYQVHHKCMNPKCVNPKHLEPVTAELNRYMQAAGVGDLSELEPAPF